MTNLECGMTVWDDLAVASEDELRIREMVERVRALEAQAELDRALITELQNEITTLRVALETCRRISAAVGIVMATHKVTQEQAFDALRTISQHRNQKLRDVADEIVFTGALPSPSEAKRC